MDEENASVVGRVLKYAIAGSFAGMVTVGGVLWFDISSIKSLFAASDSTLLANLFLSGAMIKGAVIGAAMGTATFSLRRQPALVPVGTRRTASR